MIRTARLAAAFVLAAAAIAAGAASGQAQAPAPSPTPAAVSKSLPGRAPKLSSREKAARIRDLSEDDRRWLMEFVEPIILPEEVNLFLQVPAGYPREMFREDFWKRRENDGLPPPFGPGYRSRYEHLREIAETEYEGLFGDAGRMVVRRGEPAGIEELKDCSEVYRQAEIWTYPARSGSARDENHIFYRPSFGAPRRLWLPGDTEIFQTASCLATFDQACATTTNGAPPKAAGTLCPGMSVPRTCRLACAVSRVAEEISARGPAAESASASFAPPVSTEGLDQLWLRLATSVDPGARRIAVEGPSGPAPRPVEAEPSPAGWSSDAIRDRIIALPKKYRDFLDIAKPLMSDAELVAFLASKPSDRDGFIRKFWRGHSKKG